VRDANCAVPPPSGGLRPCGVGCNVMRIYRNIVILNALKFGLAFGVVLLCAAKAGAQTRLDASFKAMPHVLPTLTATTSIETDRGDPKYCTPAAWQLAEPLKRSLKAAVDQIERANDGGYPDAITFPSERGSRVQFVYQKTRNSYAVGIASIHVSSVQYVGALHDIMACSTVYVGSSREIGNLGLYVPPADSHAPFLYFSPLLGLYNAIP
jgi:hypothetical protein